MAKLQTLGIKVPPDPALFPAAELLEVERVRRSVELSEQVVSERALLTKVSIGVNKQENPLKPHNIPSYFLIFFDYQWKW